MKKHHAVWALALVANVFPLALGADSTSSQNIARIGVLAVGGPAASQGGEYIERWKRALGDAGFVDGRNARIDVRWAEGKVDRLPALAADLVASNPDVIFAPLLAGARAARDATRTIPIVTTSIDDPVAEGLVASLSRPGGNLTGVSNMNKELRGKTVELVRSLAPSATVIGVLMSDTRTQGAALEDLRGALNASNLQAAVVYASSPQELDAAIASLGKQRVGAAIVVGGSFLYANAQRLVDGLASARMPAIYPFAHYVEKGGLMSYGPDLYNQYDLAATYVAQILKGARPQELPVQQPTKIELVVNLRAAKALGVAIPPAILLRADRTLR